MGFSLQPHWDLTLQEAEQGQLSPTQLLKDAEAVRRTLLMLVHRPHGQAGPTQGKGQDRLCRFPGGAVDARKLGGWGPGCLSLQSTLKASV